MAKPKLTAKEAIESLVNEPVDFPYDGIILEVFPGNCTVQPVGQSSSRVKRNVLIPDHIKYEDLKAGIPCRMGISQGKPILTAIFPQFEYTKYSGKGTVIPSPTQITLVTATESGWQIKWNANTRATSYKLYRNNTKDSASMIYVGQYGKAATSANVALDPDGYRYFAIRVISGMNASGLSPWVTDIGLPTPPVFGDHAYKESGHYVTWYYGKPGTGNKDCAKYVLWRNTTKADSGAVEAGESKTLFGTLPYDDAAGNFFGVQAVDYAGNRSAIAWQSSDTPYNVETWNPILGIGRDSSGVNIGLSPVDLSHIVSGLTGYKVERADKPDGTGAVVLDNLRPYSGFPMHVDQAPGPKWYRLTAYHVNGVTTISEWTVGVVGDTIKDDFSGYGNGQDIDGLHWLQISDFNDPSLLVSASVPFYVFDGENNISGSKALTVGLDGSGLASINVWVNSEHTVGQNHNTFASDDFITFYARARTTGPFDIGQFYATLGFWELNYDIPGHEYDMGRLHECIIVSTPPASGSEIELPANTEYFFAVRRSELLHLQQSTSGYPIETHQLQIIGVHNINNLVPPGNSVTITIDDVRHSKADPDDPTTFNDTGAAWDNTSSVTGETGVWHIYSGNIAGEPAYDFSYGQVSSAGTGWYLSHIPENKIDIHYGTIQSGTYIKRNDGQVGLAFYVKSVTPGVWTMYAVEADSAANKVRLVKWVDGVRTVIKEATFTFNPNTQVFLGANFSEIDLDPGRIKVYASTSDGNLISAKKMLISVKDTSITPGGTVGLLSYHCNCRFFKFVAGSPAHAEVADIAHALDGPILNDGRTIKYFSDTNSFKWTTDGLTWNDTGVVATAEFSTAADAWLSEKTSDDLAEGDTNLYFTDDRVIANSVVAANTAARHAAVTVTDTTSIDFTLTTGQALSAVVLPAGVDHNSLSNYVANKHIDHTAVSITGAGALGGGGTIASNRTITLNTPGELSATSTNNVGINHTHAIDSTIARSAITITAGAGLTGTGDLTANRTLAVGAGAGITVNADDVALTTPGSLTATSTNTSTGSHTHAIDSTIARSAITITAGAGLSGGGDISANRTLAVGAGDGVDVAADSVAVDVTDFIDTAAGLKEDASNNIQVNLGTGLTFSTGAVVLNYSGTPGTIAPDASAAAGTSAYAARTDHVHAIATAAPGANSVNLSASAEGTGNDFARALHTHNLDQSIAPTWTGIHKFTAAGQPTVDLGTDWGYYNHKWRTIHAGELRVETLVAQDVMATIGGQIVVSPTTKLVANCSAAATTIDVEHNNLANTDYVILKSAPGGVPQFEVMRIASTPTTITGGYRYTVTRNVDGTGANVWYAGDAVMELGAGYIDLTATSTVLSDYGPTIAIYDRISSTTWNDLAPVTAMGNLQSFFDYSGEIYGLAAGNDLNKTASTGFRGMTVDPTNGLRLFNTDIKLYEGSTLMSYLNSDGTALLGNTTEIGDFDANKGILFDYDTNTLSIAGSVLIGNGASFHATDVKLHLPLSYAGGFEADTNGHDGTAPTTCTAVNGVAGGPYGNGMAQFAVAVTNYIPNPTFESSGSSYWSWSNTTETYTTDTVFGSRSTSIASNNTVIPYIYNDGAGLTVSAGTSYTFSAWVKAANTASIGLNTIINLREAGGAVANDHTAVTEALTGDWQRITVTRTIVESDRTRINHWIFGPTTGTMLISAVQLTATAYQQPFIYGDMNGCSWSGTQYASTSTSVASELKYPINTSPKKGTVFCTYTPSSYATDSAYHGILSIGTSSTSGAGALQLWKHNSNSLYARLRSATNTSIDRTVASSTIGYVAGDKVFIAMTWEDGGNLTLYAYVNGVLKYSGATAIASGALANAWNTNYMWVGKSYSNCRANGGLSDVVLSDRVYTADEIRAIALSGSPVIVSRGSHEMYVAGDNGSVSVNENGIFATANKTPSFALSNANGLTWSGLTLDAGDFLFGERGSGKGGWLNFDRSTGVFKLGYGTTDCITLNTTGATIVGSVTATTGSIGGWTLGETSLTAGSGATTIGLDSGATNPAFYAGSATPASAPFRVTNAGALTATNATITGVITANTGYIGTSSGWTIASKTLTGASDSKIVSGVLQSSDWGTSAGGQIDLVNKTIKFGGSSAPKFSVAADGTLSATGASIFGSLSAASGNVTIDANGINIIPQYDDIIHSYNKLNFDDLLSISAVSAQWGGFSIDGDFPNRANSTISTTSGSGLSRLFLEATSITNTTSIYMESDGTSTSTIYAKLRGTTKVTIGDNGTVTYTNIATDQLQRNGTAGYIYVPMSTPYTVWNNVQKNTEASYITLNTSYVPANAKAVYVRITHEDRTGGGDDHFFSLGMDATNVYQVLVRAQVENRLGDAGGIVHLKTASRLYYKIVADSTGSAWCSVEISGYFI